MERDGKRGKETKPNVLSDKSKLSSLVDNLTEEVNEVKYKYGHENEKRETCEIKYIDL